MTFILFTESNATHILGSNVDGCTLRVKFLELAKELNHSQLSDEDFFLQIWSFVQGYLLLVKNGLAKYNPKLVEHTILQLVKEK